MTSRAWAVLRAGAGFGEVLAVGVCRVGVGPSSPAQPVRARARQAAVVSRGMVRQAVRIGGSRDLLGEKKGVSEGGGSWAAPWGMPGEGTVPERARRGLAARA